jgi:U4/U6 small nuclear ribonucleoprotein SNU13
MNLIVGPEEYRIKIYENFFKKQIEDKLCKEEIFFNKKDNQFYITYSCSMDLEVNDFPTLSFYNKNLNYSIVLDYYQLLCIFERKIYFKVVFKKKAENKKWIFGRSFMEIYPLVFDVDNQKIGFYKVELSTDHPLILSFFFVVIVIIISITIYRGYQMMKKENEEKEKKQKEEKEKEEKNESEDEKEEVDKRIFPLASKSIQKEIFNAITKASQLKKIKKGANEATKTLNRGISDLIVIAADVKPLEIVLHLPLLCEDKNVPYVFVESQRLLGRACGVSRPVIAASILTNTSDELKDVVSKLKEEVEKLLI